MGFPGPKVLFHDMRNGEVVAATVDVKTGKEQCSARAAWSPGDSQIAIGLPFTACISSRVNIHDVELLNVQTGEIRNRRHRQTGPRRISGADPEALWRKEISTPFGTLSPDGKLIFFKLSAADDKYVPLAGGSSEMATKLSERSRRTRLLRYRALETALLPPRLGTSGVGPVIEEIHQRAELDDRRLHR